MSAGPAIDVLDVLDTLDARESWLAFQAICLLRRICQRRQMTPRDLREAARLIADYDGNEGDQGAVFSQMERSLLLEAT